MRKNSGLAAVLSFFICGLGQIYNGEIGKGLVMFFVYSIGIGMTFWFSFFWALLCVGLWILGIVNAYTTAEEMNVKMIRFELQQKKEAEKNTVLTTTSSPGSQSRFKRRVNPKLANQNFKPID